MAEEMSVCHEARAALRLLGTCEKRRPSSVGSILDTCHHREMVETNEPMSYEHWNESVPQIHRMKWICGAMALRDLSFGRRLCVKMVKMGTPEEDLCPFRSCEDQFDLPSWWTQTSSVNQEVSSHQIPNLPAV